MLIRKAEIFGRSLATCSATPAFLERFYDVFLASSPEVAARFAETDFVRQRAALGESFALMLEAASGTAAGREHLQAIAASHSRSGIDIPPHLYDLWLASLLQVVAEFDPACDEETLDAWRTVTSFAIDEMKAAY